MEARGETSARDWLFPAALVALAALAATGRWLPALLAVSTGLWLLCLRGAGRRSAPAVLLVSALLRLPFCSSELHGNDLYRYRWEGRVLLHGVSPLATPPDHPALSSLRDEGFARIVAPELPSPYPPLAHAFFAGAAAAGLDERGLRNAIVALDLMLVAALVGWLRATRRAPGWALVYGWSPIAVASAASGHFDPLMLLGLVGFAWAWERGHVRAAAAGLGAAILAKTVAVVLLPWLALRGPRAVLATTLPLVALGYLPHLAQGGWLGSLPAFASEFGFNASLFALLEAARPSLAMPAAGVLLSVWLLCVALTQPRVASAWALSLAGLLLLAPTVHYWYLGWFLAALPAALPCPWTRPLLAWCASIVFAIPLYRSLIGGGDGHGAALVTIEYAVPAVVALWLVRMRRPRRLPLASAHGVVPGRIAVIVPCYGEVGSLRELLPRWLATRVARVVVVDRPTGDGSEALCRALPRVDYRPLPGGGYGAAVRAGLAAAGDVDFAVVCDADHIRGPAQLEALLAPFADPRTGLVCAARGRGAPLTHFQRAGNAFVTFLIAQVWGHRFHDLGPFRALRIRDWRGIALEDDHFGWNVEMNVRALQYGLGVAEVALEPGARRHGRSRITGTLGGSLAAGLGMLGRLRGLRESL